MIVTAVILAGAAWSLWNSTWPTGAARWARVGRTGPRDVSAGSPYLNARPGVAYVGDGVCARCHRQIADAYRGHPMGRSLAPVGGAEDEPPIGEAAGLPFESNGVFYDIERRDGRVFHQASRVRPDGTRFAEVEAEVRYALGSGTRGISYLIERDGYLFQSPIAWFAQQRRWDISPGYGDVEPRPNFERPIRRECLYCHTSHVRSVPGTSNRYESPIFDGHAISCERCHGPGELHAAAGIGSADLDATIVNPARLAPELRDSVCQQCHLQGWFRFPRAGRDSFDFRPGLPLRRFLAVFVREEADPDRVELIGQVEQMESSRCFQASGGKLGCISCHDPHRQPPAATRAAYYRGRCLECHAQRACALPEPERRQRGPGEDCIACHMPRPAVANVPHTLTTDHRIPRVSGQHEPRPDHGRLGAERELPPEYVPREYHWDLMDGEERREASRDRGMALESAALALRAAPPLARLAARRAVPLLEAAVQDHPDDLPARDSLGYALGMLDRIAEAREVYETTLEMEPRRELTLPYYARTLGALRRPEQAATALRELIAANPWRSDYHLALATYCAQAQDWPGAVAACRAALQLNPELGEARVLLVQALLAAGEPAQADAEFQHLLDFHHGSEALWRQRYEQLKRAGPGARTSSPPGTP